MATDTTREAAAGSKPVPGQLWQVPTFVLGLLAVAGVAAAVPWCHERSLSGLGREIAVIRRALDQSDDSPERVLDRAQKALARIGQEPERAGEVHFLLGSIYLRLTEHVPCREANQSCRKALEHLRQAQKLGVPEDDRPRLMYRLGKAWFQTHKHWPEAIACLVPVLPDGADDPADGYRMLAQAYMHLPTPDLDRAYQANLKLLALPTADEDVLGPARLMCGEILVRQEKHAEALKMLETVASTAPRAILARTRYLQGLCHQQLKNWSDAIPYWQEALRGPDQAPGGRGRILYYLGCCYRHLEGTEEAALPAAVQAWELAVKEGGESGQAAAFRLAQIYLRLNDAGDLTDPAAALAAFRRALAAVKKPEDYHNELYPRSKACTHLEWAFQLYREHHNFEQALELAALFGRLTAPEKASELEGQAAEAWARELQGQPRPAASQAAWALDRQIKEQLQRAGDAYRTAAVSSSGQARAKLLWQSAQCYLDGDHTDKAVIVLEEFVQLPGLTDSWRGEGWYRLAQTRKVLGRQPQAYVAFCKAIEFPGPFEFQARYQLARSKLAHAPLTPKEAAQDLEAAQALLEQILTPENQLAAPPEVQEKARLELARVLFLRKEYDQARLHFKEVLDRYPNHPHVFHVRDQLAECYRRLADKEELEKQARLPDLQIAFRQKKMGFLDQAALAYLSLADDLTARAVLKPGLSPEDQGLLRRARFNAAECRLGQQDMVPEALRLYRDLAEKHYPGRVESLVAYQMIWKCLCMLGRGLEAREAALRALKVVKELPDEAYSQIKEDWFRGSPGPAGRPEWERWFQQAVFLADQVKK